MSDNHVNSDAASFRVFLLNTTPIFLLTMVTTISVRCQVTRSFVSSGHIPPRQAYRQTGAASAVRLTAVVGGRPAAPPGSLAGVSRLLPDEAKS